MLARSWDNETSYRKRVAVIASLVLLLIAGLVMVTRHVPPREIYRYVGWRGELELMPEITIVPDQPSPDDAAAAASRTRSEETVALDLRENGDLDVSPPRSEPGPEKPLALTFDDFSEFPAIANPARPEISYSDAYVILRMVKPQYPPRELEDGIEGNVTVELLVDERGHVAEANVVSSIGPSSFCDSALEAAREFLFQPPTTEDGKPTTMWVKFLVKFRMYG